MGSSFSTTSDSQVATGLITSPLVKKLPNGSAAGTSRIHVFCFGGNRDSNSESGQDVTLIYRSVNGQSYTERDYADAQYVGGYWNPHCASIVDTSVGAMGVGDTVRYQMYVRCRGRRNGSHSQSTQSVYSVPSARRAYTWLNLNHVFNFRVTFEAMVEKGSAIR